jgi:hypothetical protein
VECCVLLLKFKADATILSHSGLLAYDVASSEFLKTVLASPEATENSTSLAKSRSAGLGMRRHSISLGESPSSASTVALNRSSSSGGSTSPMSPSHRARVQRERSISSPFAPKKRTSDGSKESNRTENERSELK